MESWDMLLSSYSSAPGPRDFTKAVETAKIVLKEDLASFEIDYFLETLLRSQVKCLEVLSEHYHEDSWSSSLGNCVDLLKELVDSYEDHLSSYVDDICKALNLPFASHVRRRALLCLCRLSEGVAGGAAAAEGGGVLAGAMTLDEPVTVRVVRAQLVGTICQFHPVLLSNGKEFEIWRTFLSILEAAKTTDSLINGVLIGINGLLKHFGQNLQVSELNAFYGNLSKRYIDIWTCQEACLQILSNHAHLFPECVSNDTSLRRKIWFGLPNVNAVAAILKIYAIAANEKNVQTLIATELYHRLVSKSIHERSTALSVISALLNKFKIPDLEDTRTSFERYLCSLCTKLEFGLSSKVESLVDDLENDDEYHDKWDFHQQLVNYVREASLCVQSSAVSSEVLLRLIMTIHGLVPTAQRKKLVVHTLLKADGDLRCASTIFLISETCQSDGQTNKKYNSHMNLWQSIFDSEKGKDEIVLERSKLIFKDVIKYLIYYLDVFVENELDNFEKTKDKLSNLLRFASKFVQFENVSDYVVDYIEVLLEKTLISHKKYGFNSGLVYFVSTIVCIADENCLFEDGTLNKDLVMRLKLFYKSLRVETCKDENVLCATCLALVQAPDILACDRNSVLTATQVIFSRNDVEAQLLSKSLKSFENTINRFDDLDPSIVNDIILKIQKLNSRKNLTGKEARILQRDVVLFLGKYNTTKTDMEAKSDKENKVIAKLKNSINLDIQDTVEGNSLKINLHRILELALDSEDSKALNTLLLIVSSELSTKPTVEMQLALACILYKLSRCLVRGQAEALDLERAVLYCDNEQCVRLFVGFISSESSPGVRRVLSSLLQTVLLKDSLADSSEMIIRTFIEQVLIGLRRWHATSERVHFELTEALINVLRENNNLFIEFLPTLISLVTKMVDNDPTINRLLKESFQEKIVLFKEDILTQLAKNLIKNVSVNINLDGIMFCLEILKDIYSILKLDFLVLHEELCKCMNFEDYNPKIVYLLVLSSSKEIFELNDDTSRKIISKNNFFVLKVIKELIESFDNEKEINDTFFDSMYKVFSSYASEFMELKYLATIEYLSAILKSTPYCYVQINSNTIGKCFSAYQKQWKDLPQNILSSFKSWSEKLQLEQFTEEMQAKSFDLKHHTKINAFRKLLKILKINNVATILCDVKKCVAKWQKIILGLYGAGFVDEFLNVKLSLLTDVMAVTFYFLNRDEVKGIMLECHSLIGVTNEKIGLKFTKYFINVFADYLLESEMLLDKDMMECCVLLKDMIGYFSKQISFDKHAQLMVLVDKLWPSLLRETSFETQHWILMTLIQFDTTTLTLGSNPGLWLLDEMSTAPSTDVKVKLMQVLPSLLKSQVPDRCTELYSSSLQSYSSILPVKLIELNSREDPAAVQAILSSLSVTGHGLLMELVMTVFAFDETQGWWDKALADCMATLAVKNDLEILKTAYRLSNKNDMSICLLERVVLPLIRNSPTAINEQFFSEILSEVLDTTRRRTRAPGAKAVLKVRLTQYARAFVLAGCAFDVLPLPLLESPTSPLYSKIELKSKTLAQELCKTCITLRTDIRSGIQNDEPDLDKYYRTFHTANLKCFASILSKTRPNIKFYSFLFKEDVWPTIVDCRKPYTLYIEPHGHVHTKLHQTTSIQDGGRLTLSTSLTSRTKLFYRRTLSDNPLAYDFMSYEDEEEIPKQLIKLQDNEINKHPAAASLTSVLKYLADSENGPQMWLDPLLGLLCGSAEVNVKLFVLQLLLNCKSNLNKYSDLLIPTVLTAIDSTPYAYEDKILFNGLHVNWLNQLALWQETTNIELNDGQTDRLTRIIKIIIDTMVHHKTRKTVNKCVGQCLVGLVKVYANLVKEIDWSVFEDYLKDQSNDQILLEIFIILTKQNIYIPNLTETVIRLIENKNYHNKLSNLAELLGQCLATSKKKFDRPQFDRLIVKLRTNNCQDYVKVLFYVQRSFAEACDELNFRHIADLAPKLIREQKSKCYEILSTYLTRSRQSEYITDMFDNINVCETIVGENAVLGLKVVKSGLAHMDVNLKRRSVFLAAEVCSSSNVKIKMAAYEVLTSAFEDIFKKDSTEPQAKRQKTSHSSDILNLMNDDDIYKSTVVAKLGVGLLDENESVRKHILTVLNEYLCQNDLCIRLNEIFLILFYLPTSICQTEVSCDVTRWLTVFVRVLLYGLRSKDSFKNVTLKNRPLDDVGSATLAPSGSILLSMSKTFQGTFRRLTSNVTHNKNIRRKVKKTNSNVQVSIDDVIESLMEFSQTNAEAASTLFLEIVKSLIQDGGESKVILSKMVTFLVKNMKLSETTPSVVEVCKLCIDLCCQDNGFKQSVEQLVKLTQSTEAECVMRILHEEILLRQNDCMNIFVMGKRQNETDVVLDSAMGDDTKGFAIEELSKIFGNLSDWDNLTVQDKTRIMTSDLPVVWTDNDGFKETLNRWRECGTPIPIWCDKLLMSLQDSNLHSVHYKWLKDLNQWPRNQFELSATTEAIEWHSLVCEDDLKRLPTVINSDDCLAKWAFRLMIRSAYLTKLAERDDSESILISQYKHRNRVNELAWCQSANERGLAELVLQCVGRNSSDLLESETLPWLHQQVTALRRLGVDRNDCDTLQKALQKTEVYTEEYSGYTSPETVLAMYGMCMKLNQDLDSLNTNKVEAILKDTEIQTNKCMENGLDSNKCMEHVLNLYTTAFFFYEKLWHDYDEKTHQENILYKMATCVSKVNTRCRLTVDGCLSNLALKMAEYNGDSLPEDLSELIVDILSSNKEISNEIKQEFCKLSTRFHKNVQQKLLSRKLIPTNIEGVGIDKDFGLMLQLVCDPSYVLLQYVDLLMSSLAQKDSTEWGSTMNNIKSLLENRYAGPAYVLLYKYRDVLKEIEFYETSKPFREKSMKILNEARNNLLKSSMKIALDLRDVCPALSNGLSHMSEGDARCLNELLRLPAHVGVVRFFNQIQIFTNSKRRPCIITALLSDGKTRRFLIKRGESLRLDAAATRLVDYFNKTTRYGVTSYFVTPLSDDSGLIEFLEDHTTLRSLLGSYDLDGLPSLVRRAEDVELVATSTGAREIQFDDLCQRIPAYSLRSSIQSECSSIQDYIVKRIRFTDSLCSTTIYNWILGLGDRHMENFLYSTVDGAVCAVDWAAILQYGGSRVPELQPARLTRVVIGACDFKVIESRLQTILQSLKEKRNLLKPIIRLLFNWMANDDSSKINYIEDILDGKILSYQITRQILDQSSEIKYKEKYIGLLDQIFGQTVVKESYDVVDQVSTLLLQCTEPSIMSVSRTGWEPWL